MASRGLNKATLLGHVGKDAELRYTNTGKAVATFSLATSEGYKGQDGNWVDKSTWHNIVAWDRLAEICGNYVKKGKQVYVEGRIQNRSYDDKDGVKKYISEIVANELILLGGGGGGGERGDSGGGYQSSANNHSSAPSAVESYDQNVPDSDLPF
jgi:single-strand DNA-binding protein